MQLGEFSKYSKVSMDQYGQIWMDLDRNRQIWIEMNRYRQKWIDLDRNKYKWIDMDRNRYIWIEMDRFGYTLESLIAVGLRLLIFEDFSTPYAVIRDPTLIKICKIKPHPTLIRNIQ